VETSRALAQRVLEEEVGDANILGRAFYYALGRPPTSRETTVMTAALQRYRQNFMIDPKGAESLLKVGDTPRDLGIKPGEHAAWMMICSTIMNTDEFLSQH